MNDLLEFTDNITMVAELLKEICLIHFPLSRYTKIDCFLNHGYSVIRVAVTEIFSGSFSLLQLVQNQSLRDTSLPFKLSVQIKWSVRIGFFVSDYVDTPRNA